MGFPRRFESTEHALAYCRAFFAWYNKDHRHGGTAMLPPAAVHDGRAQDLLAKRQTVLMAAYEAHPERFPKGPPVVRQLDPATYINPPTSTPDPSVAEAR